MSPPSVTPPASVSELLRSFPVVLAPMEDVTDAVYRRICRSVGAELCVTEFVHAQHMVARTSLARRKALLAPDDQPTAIQIYGPDPAMLMQAAEIAAEAAPAFIDINCGCWVPRVARKGAGAAWLRDPAAMVEMARRVVAAAGMPVTVKTRIGLGPESHMPIIDLARRLEDVGVAALTIHCRTAHMGHTGAADWAWARRAREVVSIPVVVNGDVRTADDVTRALDETGCAAVMIGRGAIDHPWVFREARARLAGAPVVPPTDAERAGLYRAILHANVAARGERAGVPVTRRHLAVLGPAWARVVRPRLFAVTTVAEVEDVLAEVGSSRPPGTAGRVGDGAMEF
jgi:nifR3 family TIM-barrel protein